MRGTTIRIARDDEVDEVRKLLESAYRQYTGNVSDVVFGIYLADLTDLERTAAYTTTLVAVAAGEIVGTARLYPAGKNDEMALPPGWAWVRAVGVRPGLRRGGIARLLMAECARLAAAEGAATLSLHTAAFMQDAIRLYEGLGYRRAVEWDVSAAAHYDLEDDGGLVAYAYRLDL